MGRALLFDIDGTLANTDPLHLKAFNQVPGAGIRTIGIRTSLADADVVAAGAVASARAFDDPDLLARVAAAMAW